MRVHVGSLSGLKDGDMVRTKEAIANATKGLMVLPAGSLARLDRFQRVQEGLEIWTMWVRVGDDKHLALWGAAHTQLEKVVDE